MAQIAHVRRFNGTSDEIELATTSLLTSPANLSVVALAKKSNVDGNRNVFTMEGGSGGQYALYTSTTDQIELWTPGGAGQSGATFYVDEWVLIGVSKATGTTAPRFHTYRYSTTTFTHVDGATSWASPATPAGTVQAWIGTWDGASEWFTGDIACVGVWHGTALSDGQFEGLISDIAAWEALSPSGLWLLNQTSASEDVLDRAGSGDQVSISGTTAVAESGLAFEVGGAAAAPATILRPAMVV